MVVGYTTSTALAGGTGTVTVTATNSGAHTYTDQGSYNVTVAPTSGGLNASTSFMNNDDQDLGLCAAACFAMTASRGTVPYYTLDAPRSVTLAYNGDRAFPRPFIYVDVSAQSAPSAIQSYTLEVRRNGVDLPFTNSETALTFQGTTSPSTVRRLAGQIDMSGYATGIDSVTAVVTAHYTDGETGVATATTRLMIVNSTLNSDASPVAKGWGIAGLQHLRATPEGPGTPGIPGGGYMIEDGDGSAMYFWKTDSHAEDYSTLSFDSVATWTRTYLDGSKVLFDLSGRMTAAIDRLGRTTQFAYGGLNNMQVVSIKEPMRTSGSSTSAPYLQLSYDGNHNLSSIVEMGGTGGRTTTVTVDANGHLTRVTDPDGKYDSYGYDASGRLHTITDRRGSTTTYNYGPSWKLAGIVSPSVPIDAGGGSTIMGTLTTTIEPWQAVGVPFTTTASNPAPLLEADTIAARVIGAKHDTSVLSPNRWGEPVKTIDAMGNVTTIEYQDLFATVITHPDGSADSASYNSSSGLLTAERQAGQQWINYTYGARNQLLTESGSGVVSVTNTLDTLGRVTKSQYGSVAGDTATFTYDPVTRNVASTVQPDVGRTVFVYDSRFGNTQADTAPGHRVTQLYFDAFGRDTASRAPQYPMTRTQYDVLNRVMASYDGVAPNPVRITYDAMLPVAVRDPLSHVDSTEYDALGRVTRHFGYASSTVPTTIRYDSAGRPTSTTNRRGQRIDVTYDVLGRVLTKIGDSTTTDRFTYSTDGLVQTAANDIDSVRVVSNPKLLRDSVQTTIRAGGVVQHTYSVVHFQSSSASGTDSTTISSNGAPVHLVTRRYMNDATNGTLAAINLGTTIGQGTFTSDVAGWRTATSWPSSLGGSGASRTSAYLSTGVHAYSSYGSLPFYVGYQVDSATRIQKDHRYYADSGAYTNHIFGYDALGRYTGTTSVRDRTYPWVCGGSGRFDPDYGQVGCAIDSLPKPNTYSYDYVGNRIGSGITYTGAADQVTTSDGMSYTYDADGNAATRTQASTDTVWTYRWSSDNRLLSAVKTVGGVQVGATSFDYDALGEPVVKRAGASGTAHASRVTLYDGVYDGGSILADLDSAGHRIAEYVYDQGTDEPYAMLTGSDTVSAVRYYAQDDMGNVQGQFSDYAHTTQTVKYGDWGLPKVSGEATNRLTWKGLSYDPDVGLTYMRARWYDPNIGRFVSEDPLGLQGGINPYVYANNDPVNGSDPSGMDAMQSDDDTNCKLWLTLTLSNGDTINLWCVESGGPAKPIAILGHSAPFRVTPILPPPDPFASYPWNFTGDIDAQQGQVDSPAGGGAGSSTPTNSTSRRAPAPTPSQPTNLFLTQYCGLGGGGTPVNALDTACQQHDACYQQGGVTAISNFNPFPGGGELRVLRRCNNALCAAAAAHATTYGSVPVFLYFRQVPVLARCFH
jgi:RHS repeat-associated protein